MVAALKRKILKSKRRRQGGDVTLIPPGIVSQQKAFWEKKAGPIVREELKKEIAEAKSIGLDVPVDLLDIFEKQPEYFEQTSPMVDEALLYPNPQSETFQMSNPMTTNASKYQAARKYMTEHWGENFVLIKVGTMLRGVVPRPLLTARDFFWDEYGKRVSSSFGGKRKTRRRRRR